MKKEIQDNYKFILTLIKDVFPEKIPIIIELMKGHNRKTKPVLSNLNAKLKSSNMILAVNILSDSQNKDIASLFLISIMKSFNMDLPTDELLFESIKESITLNNAIPYLAYYTLVENIDNCNIIKSTIHEFQNANSIECQSNNVSILIEQLTLENTKLKTKNKELLIKIKEIKSELKTCKKELIEQENICTDRINKNNQYEERILKISEDIKKKDEIIQIEILKNEKLTIGLEYYKNKSAEALHTSQQNEKNSQTLKNIILFGENRGLAGIKNINFTVVGRNEYTINKINEYLELGNLVYVILADIPADFKFHIGKTECNNNLKLFKDKQEFLQYLRKGD